MQRISKLWVVDRLSVFLSAQAELARDGPHYRSQVFYDCRSTIKFGTLFGRQAYVAAIGGHILLIAYIVSSEK